MADDTDPAKLARDDEARLVHEHFDRMAAALAASLKGRTCAGFIWAKSPSKRAPCKNQAGDSGFCERHDPALQKHRNRRARCNAWTRRFNAALRQGVDLRLTESDPALQDRGSYGR